jgi:DNA invertase Pin-like site-specific DNA recombinase
MTRAFAYMRCSGRAQIEGDSFPRQHTAIEAYAAVNGIKIVRWFEEQGVSGKTEWDNRPAWVEMVGALDGVRMIIVERLDRLARDLGVQEWIVRELHKRGVTLVSTAEPDLGSEDPTRILFRQIMGAIAQFDKTMIVCKLRAARDRIRKRTGKCEGRKVFGSHPDFPREPEVLALIMQWHRDGGTFNEIAGRLNEARVSTRDSGRWFGATVSRIVRRELEKEL